jgi:hypothetical protein
MSYTTQRLKTALPLYPGPITVKQRVRKSALNIGFDDKDLYARRISELRLELETLNILDHPLRIIEICSQIRKLEQEISRSDG